MSYGEKSRETLLLIGSSGFIGSSILPILKKHFTVVQVSRKPNNTRSRKLDLADIGKVKQLLEEVKPDIIVNCAGVVSGDFGMNVEMTNNILNATLILTFRPRRIIILGSAAEYGLVPNDVSVNEQYPSNPVSEYGQSKHDEVISSLEIARKNHLPLTVLRIFNPVGPKMSKRFLIAQILTQLDKIVESANTGMIEVSRHDTSRDYFSVKDIGEAIVSVCEGSPTWDIYNIGSGIRTTNRELVELVLEKYRLKHGKISLVETNSSPEPSVASCADISRIRNDLGWKPKHTLEEAIEEIIDEKNRRKD